MIVKCEVVISYLKYDKFKFVLFGSLEIEGEKKIYKMRFQPPNASVLIFHLSFAPSELK